MPDSPNKPKVDFLPFFAGGVSHDDLQTDVAKNNYDLMLLPEDQAYGKYTGKDGILPNLPKEKFHDIYQQAKQSYDDYTTQSYNQKIATSWQADKPEPKSYEGVMPAGVDQFGRMIATPSEIAAKRGYVVDRDGKQQPYKEPGAWQKMWDIPSSMFFAAISPELAPLLQGDDPSSVMIVDHDETGTPFYRMVAADDPKVLRSQIASAWGPQKMNEHWYAALLKGAYNGVIGAESMIGSVAEQTNKFIDFVTTGQDSNSWLERRGRVYQNLAKRSQIPVGVEGSGDFFSSASAAAYSIGSLIPIVLLTRGGGAILKGAGVAEEVAHSASTFAFFTGLGMDSYTEMGKEMGLDPADLAWQVMVAGPAMGAIGMVSGPKFLTKGLVNAELKGQVKNLFGKAAKELEVTLGQSFKDISSESKLRFIKDLQNPVYKLLLSSHQMGQMMALMDVPEIGMQTINDLRAYIKNPNTTPGKGQFDTYDPSRSFVSNIMDRLPSKMLGSYVNGFVSGLLYTPVEEGLRAGVEKIRGKEFNTPHLFSKMKDATLENIAVTGRGPDALRIIDKEEADSGFGRETHTIDGDVRTENDPRPSENHVRAEAARQDVMREVEKANLWADPSVRKNFGDNISPFREVLQKGKEIEALRSEMDASPEKAGEIQPKIDQALSDIKDITEPEEGSRYSKKYNDLIKTGLVRQAQVWFDADNEWKKNHNGEDPTAKDRISPEWRNHFNESLKKDEFTHSYDDSKLFSLDVDKEIDRRRSFNQSVENQENEALPLIGNIREAIKATGKEEDIEKRITGIRTIVGMIGEVARKIDMSRQVNLQQEYEDFKQKFLGEVPFMPENLREGAMLGYGQAFGDENIFTQRSPNRLSETRSDVINDLLTSDIRRQVDGGDPLSVASMAASPTSNPSLIRGKIKELSDQVNRNMRITEVGYVLGQHPEVKPHLSKSDLVFSSDQADRISGSLNRLGSELYLRNAINELKLHNTDQKYIVQHLDKQVRSLENIVPAIVKVIPEINDLIKAIPKIDDAWKQMDYPLSGENLKTLNTIAKQLTDIKSRIFENSDKITGSDEYKSFIEDLVNHRRLNGFGDGYLNSDFYNTDKFKTSLEALSTLTRDDDYLLKKDNTSFGYLNTINFLIESLGVHSRSIELARAKALAEGKRISSPLMQQAENLAFAFMTNDKGNAHKVLQDVVEQEIKALKDWKGIAFEEESKAYRSQLTENAIFIGGESGTGKSTEFLKGVFDLQRNYDPQGKKKVAVLTASDGNEKILREKGLSGVDAEYFNLSDLLKNNDDIAKKVKNADYIVIDESQRLLPEDLKLLRDHFYLTGTILYLGDTKQGFNHVTNVGVKTIPFTERVNLNNPLVNVLQDYFRGIGKNLPNGFVENENGLRYYNTTLGVQNAFYADPSVDKVLILNPSDYDALPDDLKARNDILTLGSGVQDVTQYPSVRGSLFKKAYVGFTGDKTDMYSAVTRGTDFVAYPTDQADKLNKADKSQVAWVDTPTEVPQDIIAQQGAQEEARLRTIVGDQNMPVKAKTPDKDKTPISTILPITSTPNVGDTFRVRKGGYARIVSIDGKTVKAITGDKVDDLNRIKDLSDKSLKPETFNIDELSYLDEAHKTRYNPQEPTAEPVKENSYTKTGEAYAYTHYTFGDVTQEQHRQKQRATTALHELMAFFVPELTYHKSQKLHDDSGKPVTRNDLLAVRFTLNPTANTDDFLKQLSSRVELQVYKDIEKSIKATGELPDAYRYLMVLDEPNDKLTADQNARLTELIGKGREAYINKPEEAIVLSRNIPLKTNYATFAHYEYETDDKGKEDKTKPIFIPFKELYDKVAGKVIFDHKAEAPNLPERGRERQKLIIRYDPIHPTAKSDHIILRTPKLEELAKRQNKSVADILQDREKQDRFLHPKEGEKIHDHEDEWLWDFIHNNRAQAEQVKGFKEVLGKYGKWDTHKKIKGVRYQLESKDKNVPLGEKQQYKALWDDLIKGSEGLGTLELPFRRKYTLEHVIEKGDEFLTNAHDLYPHTYLNIRDLRLEEEKAVDKKAAETVAGIRELQQMAERMAKEKATAEPITKPVTDFWHQAEDQPKNIQERTTTTRTNLETGKDETVDLGKKLTRDDLARMEQEGVRMFVGEKDGYKVYELDDSYVKTNIFNDFTEGGNGWAYPNFIPIDEVWVAKDKTPENKEAIIFHEINEANRMSQGFSYNEAHTDSNNGEMAKRQGAEVQPAEPVKPVEVAPVIESEPPKPDVGETMNTAIRQLKEWGDQHGISDIALRNLYNGITAKQIEAEEVSNDSPKFEFFYSLLGEENRKGILADIKKSMKHASEDWRKGDITDTKALQWVASNIDTPDWKPKGKQGKTFNTFLDRVNTAYDTYLADKGKVDDLIAKQNNEPRPQVEIPGLQKGWKMVKQRLVPADILKSEDFTVKSDDTVGEYVVSQKQSDTGGVFGVNPENQFKFNQGNQYKRVHIVVPNDRIHEMRELPISIYREDLKRIARENRSPDNEVVIDLRKNQIAYVKGEPPIQASKELSKPDITLAQKVRDDRLTQKQFRVIFDKLESAFPQLHFIEETSESLQEKGVDPSLRGYIDNEGIHYNIDKVTASTGVHELQHIWNQVLKYHNTEQYSEFEDYIRKSIEAGNNDISVLSDEIAKRYPELSTSQHLDEVLATIGGFTSIPAVERYLSENEIPQSDPNFVTRLYNSVKQFVNNLWSGIKDVLGLKKEFDTGNPDLNKFFSDFTDQVFRGDKFTFSDEELRLMNVKPTSRALFVADRASNKPIEVFQDEDIDKVEKAAIRHFGTTDDFKLAGFLTVSGELLDFSGQRQGSMGRSREMDHREVSFVLDDINLGSYKTDPQWQGTSSGSMNAFVDMGNIRLSPESGGIDMTVKPVQPQFTQLRKYIDEFNGEVILDMNNYSGDGVSVEYPKWTDTDKIIQDIKRWYDYEIPPRLEQLESRDIFNAPFVINDLQDLVTASKGQYQDPIKFTFQDRAEVTDELFKRVKANGLSGDNYYYKYGDKQIPFDAKKYSTDALLKEAIDEKLTSYFTVIDQKLPQLTMQFINLSKELPTGDLWKARSLREIGEAVFGGRVSDRVLNDLVFSLGLNNQAVEALRYSDLISHKDETVRNLYKDGLTGFDPVVVYYGQHTDGKPIISLFDVTPRGLGQKLDDPSGENILSNFMPNKTYKGGGGPAGWGNKEYDYRRLSLGMQMLGMDAHIKNAGVLQVNFDKVKQYPLQDLEDVGKILDVLKTRKEFMDNINNPVIRDIIEKKRKDWEDYHISFYDQWLNGLYQQSQSEDSESNWDAGGKSIQAIANYIFDPKTNKDDHIEVLKGIQRDYMNRIEDEKTRWQNPDFLAVCRALDELRNYNLPAGYANKVSDIKWGAKGITPPAIMAADVIQRVVNEGMISSSIIVDEWMKYHKQVNESFKEMASWYMNKYPKGYNENESSMKALIKDAGHMYYNPMRKTAEAIASRDMEFMGKKYKKGETIKAYVPFLHMDANDPETAEKLRLGELDPKHLKLANQAWDIMKERQVKNIYNAHILDESPKYTDDLGNPTYTMADAERQFETQLAGKGFIPTIERSAGDLLTNGYLKEGIKQEADFISSPEELFKDFIENRRGANAVYDGFARQMADPEETYNMMGLRLVRNGTETTLEMVDPEANITSSGNLERIANYFMLKGIRDEVIKQRFLPVYNEAMTITDAYERVNEKELPHVKDAMRQLMERFVMRKTQDKKYDATITIGGHTIQASTLTRLLIHGMSNFLLMYRLSTSPKVFISNFIRTLNQAIATNIAQAGTDRADGSIMPGSKELVQALEKFGTDGKKLLELGRMFQFVNRSERNLMSSPFLNIGLRKNLDQQAYGFLLENGVDAFARVHAMTMMMLKNGAYEAYSVNEKTGEVEWDKHKDKRYWSQKADGTYYQTNEQAALYNGLIKRLKDQGLMKPTDTEPDRGDDWDIVNNQYKWFASQYVYPGMNDFDKILMTNVYYGMLFSQFRMFLPNALFNVGLFAHRRKTIAGSQFKPVQLPNGEWATERELREIEGQATTWGSWLKDIYQTKDFGKAWENLDEGQRTNLVRSMVNATWMAGIGALIMGLPKKDEQRFSYLWNELMIGFAAEGFFKTPIPLFGQVANLNQIVLGQKNFNQLINMSGIPGGLRRMKKITGLEVK